MPTYRICREQREAATPVPGQTQDRAARVTRVAE